METIIHFYRHGCFTGIITRYDILIMLQNA